MTRKMLHEFRQLLFCNSLAEILESAEEISALPICTVVDYAFSTAMVTEEPAASVDAEAAPA
eukprot:SAG31_NODE_9450_length_1275_cov_1.510204_3_plen_61_part_01